MNVAKLIEALQGMPQDAEVKHVWDGCARTVIQFVWLSHGGEVITADYGEYTSDQNEFPIGYSGESDLSGWYQTPRDPAWD